jgi:hypothetical protein
MARRNRMTREEARRYAHRLASEVIQQISTKSYGVDGPAIMSALAALAEQHVRYGPKSTDRPPNQVVPHTTPLFDVVQEGADAIP